MTENKRFSVGLRKYTTQYEIVDNWKRGDYPFLEPFYYKKTANDLAKFLNKLSDENERLKNMVGYSYEEHKRCVDNYVDKIKEVEKENANIKKILTNKRKEILKDYDKSAKAGMPTGGLIGEIDLLETIMEEIGIGDEDD